MAFRRLFMNRTAHEILYEVGFSGNEEESEYLIKHFATFIDGEAVNSSEEVHTLYKGKVIEVKVANEVKGFKTY